MVSPADPRSSRPLGQVNESPSAPPAQSVPVSPSFQSPPQGAKPQPPHEVPTPFRREPSLATNGVAALVNPPGRPPPSAAFIPVSSPVPIQTPARTSPLVAAVPQGATAPSAPAGISPISLGSSPAPMNSTPAPQSAGQTPSFSLTSSSAASPPVSATSPVPSQGIGPGVPGSTVSAPAPSVANSGKPPSVDATRSAAAPVIDLCRQFLASRGFQGAADALDGLQHGPPGLSQLAMSEATEVPHMYKALRRLQGWIDRGPECLKAELLEVAFVLFVATWCTLFRSNASIGRQFLNEFWDIFSAQHSYELNQLSLIVDPRQADTLVLWRWWRSASHFDICISRLGYWSLLEYLSLEDASGSSILRRAVQSLIVFHVVTKPVSELEVSSFPSPPQIGLGTANALIESHYPQPPIPWGLLAGPFNHVQLLEGDSKRAVPAYLKSSTGGPLALINGEVTSPVDPNLAPPLADESAWAISKLHDHYMEYAKLTASSTNAAKIPSMLTYKFSCPASMLGSACLSPSLGRWALLGRSTGGIEAWNVPALCRDRWGRAGEGTEVAEDTEFGQIDLEHEKPDLLAEGRLSTPHLLLGHTASVTAMSFITPSVPDPECPPDGLVLSASADGTVLLWSLERLQQLNVYRSEGGPIWGLDVSPYGNYFLTCGSDRAGSMWSFGRRQPIRVLSAHVGDSEVIKCWPNSVLAATGSTDGSVCMWDLRSTQRVRRFYRQPAPVTCLSVSPNGRLLASGGDGGQIDLWDVAEGKKYFSVPVQGATTCLAWSHGSRMVAAGGTDGMLRFIDAETPADSKGQSDRAAGQGFRLGQLLPCTVQYTLSNLVLSSVVECGVS